MADKVEGIDVVLMTGNNHRHQYLLGFGAIFSAIEEKGYTFPVLRGNQEDLDALDVYFYPTVIILNKKGEVVYRGEIQNAGTVLDDLL